jgi:hypothetical protein
MDPSRSGIERKQYHRGPGAYADFRWKGGNLRWRSIRVQMPGSRAKYEIDSQRSYRNGNRSACTWSHYRSHSNHRSARSIRRRLSDFDFLEDYGGRRHLCFPRLQTTRATQSYGWRQVTLHGIFGQKEA